MRHPPKVFVTGVTGYVGGDALFVVTAAHPDWHYSFLVRDRNRVAPDSALSRCPNVRFVIGELHHTDLIRQEAAAADIILTFASSDDVASAEAVRSAMTSDKETRFWIHTSGAASLLFDDKSRGIALGSFSPKLWDDVGDIQAINNWPVAVFHRPVEKIVLEADQDGRHSHVKTAVVSPPAILGVGRGPGNTRTIQVPILIDLIRRRGRAFHVGQGRARWSFVHIHDLSDIYLRLVDAATAAAAGCYGADWGRNGYYFAESGEVEWGPISSRIARRLHEAGALPTAEVDSLTAVEAKELFHPLGLGGPGMVGANSRSKATRARERLGWRPTVSNFDAAIDEQVAVELARGQSRLEDFGQGHMPKPPPPSSEPRSESKL